MLHELPGDGVEGLAVLAALLQGLALVQAVTVAADACSGGEQQAGNGHGGGIAHRPGPQAA